MRISIIAAGDMGSGVGARLHAKGAEVMTSLTGRSPASAERARRAGMVAMDDDAMLVAASDIVLSILPPAEAEALARRLAPALAAAEGRVLYADCNAIAPQTVRGVAAIVAATGARFADIGIIGGPPRADGYTPRFYASGAAADLDTLRALGDFGLDIRPVEGGVGAASAVKMSYASLTKGFTAIGIAAARNAANGNAAAVVRAELAESQPQLFAWLQRQMPGVYPKAYRWVGEMEEIARHLGDDPTAAMYRGAAQAYEDMARRWDEGGAEALGFIGDLFRK
jgi:3-hydroxyisobutyrate dehydrogenase-like beta-hydroxyacid dehydrogenase